MDIILRPKTYQEGGEQKSQRLEGKGEPHIQQIGAVHTQRTSNSAEGVFENLQSRWAERAGSPDVHRHYQTESYRSH